MVNSKVQYILSWVSAGLLLSAGFGLMILSWNGAISSAPSTVAMILLWVIISASGIYLFMFAVKKTHRLWIDEERNKKEAGSRQGESSRARSLSKENKSLDITSTARKLVRRIPDEKRLADSGEELLHNLAKELEIMSGIVYTRKKGLFKAVASYALVSPNEPFSFREGEGLTGQAAASHQIMILTQLPEGYREVYSGLGQSEPSYLAIVPLVHHNKTIAVVECTGYRYDPHDIESMFRIFARELMVKLFPKNS